MADEFVPSPRDPLTPITGSRGPENLTAERVIVDMDEKIHEYQPDAAPFVTLTGRLKDKRTATQFRFDWLEGDEFPRELELTGNALVGDNTLDVAAGAEARAAVGYIYMNVRTREHVRVTATASGVVTVTRDVVGEGEIDMNSGDKLFLLAPIAEDGDTLGPIRTTVEVPKFNYTEIIRTPYSVTGRDLNTDLYGGRDLPYLRKKMAIEHKKHIESRFFFGKRASTSGTSHLRTFTGGLEYWIRSNVWDLSATGTLSEKAFIEFLEEAMRWGEGGYLNGSGTKYLFSSARVITRINGFANNDAKLRYVTLDKQIGFSAMEYTSPHGKVMLVHTPILDYHHKGWAFLVDLNHVDYVKHQGRDTKLLKGRQANDADLETEEYQSDVGLQVANEGSLALVKGVA
jgi:hypothetical protein